MNASFDKDLTMTPQANKQKSKSQVRKKRRQSSPLGMENDQDGEKFNGHYMTRSKQDANMPISDEWQDDTEKANGKKLTQGNTDGMKRKGTKKQKLSPVDEQAEPSLPLKVCQAESTENADDETDECVICHKQFTDRHNFTLHLRKHHVGENTCKVCNITLSSSSSLDRHLLTHSKERPYKCSYCTQRFTTNGNMNRHMHKHKAKKLASNPTSMDWEKNSDPLLNTGGTSQMGENEPTIATEEGKPEMEVLEETSAPIASNTVKEKTDKSTRDVSVEQFQSSKVAKGNQSKLKSSTIVEGFSDLCFIPFSSAKFPFIAHKACEETTRLPYNGLLPYNGHKCKICDKVFPDVRSRGLHKRVHKCNSDYQNWLCSVCGVYFINKSDHNHHNVKYHSANELREDLKHVKDAFLNHLGLLKSKQEADPETDGLEFLKKKEYFPFLFEPNIDNASSQAVLDEENTQVNQCIEGNVDHNFSLQVFEKYDKSLPAKEEEMTTSDKDRGTESSNDFADIKSILSNVSLSPVTSEQSDTDRNALSVSQIKDSTDASSSDGNAEKEQAKDVFSSKKETKNRPVYPCTELGCTYKSSDKSSVARHLRTHTKEHPFVCLICSRKFTTKANGERHARKIHKMKSPAIHGCIAYNGWPNAKDPQICKYCKVNFYNNRVLRHHYRSLSNSCTMKPFNCAKCRLGFSTKNNFNRHFLNKHVSSNLAKTDLRRLRKKFCIQYSSRLSKKFKKSMINVDCQNNETRSSEASNSSGPSQEEKHSFSDDDRVNAAESLVTLSQSTQWQPFPLDLSVHALDLSPTKPWNSEGPNERPASVQSSGFSSSMNSTPLGMTPGLSRIRSLNESFSDNFSAPLDLTYTPSIANSSISKANPIILLPQDISLMSAVRNVSASHTLSPNSSALVPQENGYLNCKPATRKAKSANRIKCDYCASDFSLKTNKERHVKKKHPEHARAHESKNSVRSMQRNKISMQVPSTILNTTKNAILTRVLQNTDNNKQDLETDGGSSDQFQNKSMVKNEKVESMQETEANSDLENVDLASVSSVINTANSPHFNQYLTEDVNCNALDKSSLMLSANSDRESYHHNKRKSKENKFVCNVCSRTFQWDSGLQRHVVKHTGCKPYTCMECMVRCTTKSNLTRHYRNKHAEAAAPIQKNAFQLHNNRLGEGELQTAIMKAELEETNEVASVFSRMCDLKYNQSHMNFEGRPPDSEVPDSLECGFCKTSYKNINDLSNHIKQLHHSEYANMIGKDLATASSFWKKK